MSEHVDIVPDEFLDLLISHLKKAVSEATGLSCARLFGAEEGVQDE
jgi:hypothetical protein